MKFEELKQLFNKIPLEEWLKLSKRFKKEKVSNFLTGVRELEGDYTVTIINGIKYFDSDEKMDFDTAQKWAKERGLRVLTKNEYEVLERDKKFLKSTEGKWFWTSSVNSYSRYYAWLSLGSYGVYRNNRYGVRCVQL